MKHYRVRRTDVEYRVDGNKVSSRINKDLPWSNWIEIDPNEITLMIEAGVFVETKGYDCPNDN